VDYQRIYNQIIERAKSRINKGYVEKHHIIPKSMGGDNSSKNIVELTSREHFIVHWLLYRIYPNESSMIYSFWMMSNRFKNFSSIAYEEARINFSKAISEHMLSNKHPFRGKTHSDKTKELISMKRKLQGNKWNGRLHTKESKKKMSESAKNRDMSEDDLIKRNKKVSESTLGVKKSDEHKKNIAIAKIGNKNPMYGKKAKRLTCQHCNREIAVNMYSRYHGDKCKYYPNSLDV